MHPYGWVLQGYQFCARNLSAKGGVCAFFFTFVILSKQSRRNELDKRSAYLPSTQFSVNNKEINSVQAFSRCLISFRKISFPTNNFSQ